MNCSASAARSISDPPTFAARMLDHHDGVGAGGNGCAGHDLDGLSFGDAPFEAPAGAHLADDLELSRQIDGAHGIAVAHGARDGGGIAVGFGVRREHAPGGIGEGNFLDGRLDAALAHGAENGFAGIHKCQRRHASIIALQRRRAGVEEDEHGDRRLAGRGGRRPRTLGSTLPKIEKGQPFPAALFHLEVS